MRQPLRCNNTANHGVENMKPLLIIAIAAGFLLLTGCKGSLTERIDRAKQAAQDEQRGIGQSEANADGDYRDERPVFRHDAEEHLASNAQRLNGLRARVTNSNDEVITQLEAVTKINTDLKTKRDAYHDQGKVNWDAFKRDFSHDLDGLSKVLRNLKAENR
jgi:outer membrane murein-binding lipoprotein Lpp